MNIRKPKIKLNPYSKHNYNRWSCTGMGYAGFGLRPKLAYMNWKRGLVNGNNLIKWTDIP